MKRTEEEIHLLIIKEARKKLAYIRSYQKKNKKHLKAYSREYISKKRRAGQYFMIQGYILPTGRIDINKIVLKPKK